MRSFQTFILFAGVEAAMNWVFEHSQDADFADPLQLVSNKNSKKKDGQPEPKAEDLSMLMAMGFDDQQARKALKKNVCYVLFISIHCLC